jgi:hypothetical protein
MRRAVVPLALTLVALVVAPATRAWAATEPATLTPVVVTVLNDDPVTPVIGTDSVVHAVYELQLVNTQSAPVSIASIEVDSVDPRVRYAAFGDDELAVRLRHLDGSPVADAVVDPGAQLLLLVDVALPSAGKRTKALQHRVTVADQSFTTAPIALQKPVPTILAPPVSGTSWVVTDGCCRPDTPYRTAILSTSEGFAVPARYALDLRQMDEQGRFVAGDPAQPASYPGYGTYVYAVAPGEVVSTVDELPEQVPGAAPEPGTFGAGRDGGNSVVIRLRNGTYASYGSLQAGSVIVTPGAHVRRGQPIAKLGNSGNSAAPHLHFQLMSGPSPIGANGVPVVITAFGYSGQIDRARLAEQGLGGEYADNRLPAPQSRERQLPLDLAIIDFDASSGTSGSPLV